MQNMSNFTASDQEILLFLFLLPHSLSYSFSQHFSRFHFHFRFHVIHQIDALELELLHFYLVSVGL